MKFYTNAQVIGNFIHLREIEEGIPKYRKIKYKPTLFVPVEKKTKYKTLSEEYLQPVDFESMKAARDWMKEYEGVQNFQYYGMTRFYVSYIADNFPGKIEYDFSQLNINDLDIETESENGFPDPLNPQERVNLITVYRRGKYYSFGLNPYETERTDIVYTECFSERELFLKFLDFWESDYPDIISGWSLRSYDIPYIINRMRMLFEDDDKTVNRIAPFGKIQSDVYRYMQQETPTFSFSGLAILDYLQLYKKFIPSPRENYKLGYIAQVELGITKLDHTEYARFSDFYKNDWQKYVDYNIRDVELIGKLEDKLSLIGMIVETAYYCKCNYEDVLSQVRSWDCKVYNYLRDQGIQIPQIKFYDKDQQFEGAFVKDPNPGMYNWIIGFDFNSLYPNIARLLNIGAETKVRKVKLGVEDFLGQSQAYCYARKQAYDEGLTLGTNGVQYSKKKPSFYSVLIGLLFNERKECQKLMKEAKKLVSELEKKGDKSSQEYLRAKDIAKKMHISQYAKKIALNSLYGCMGTIYWRFYDVDNAEAITLTGQFAIRFVSGKINEYLNKLFKTQDYDYVIMNDTDSAVVQLEKLVKMSGLTDTKKIVEMIDKFGQEKLGKVIDAAINQLVQEYVNGVPDVLKMGRAEIASKSIHTSKKRYIMCVHMDDSNIYYDPPELKATGIEIKKATNPKFCRDKMEEAIKLVFASDNKGLIKFIEETRTEFNSKKSDDISMPRGTNDLEKYYDAISIFKKKCPIHIRGALLFNKRIDDLGLGMKYQKIQSGDKVRFMYLSLPNPIKENVIAFPDYLPSDFKLDPYIDYNLQFEKSFMEPLNIILKAINWQSESRGSLNKFFG